MIAERLSDSGFEGRQKIKICQKSIPNLSKASTQTYAKSTNCISNPGNPIKYVVDRFR